MKRRLQPLVQASCLQVSRAWRSHYGRPIPEDVTFQALADQLVKDLGQDQAAEFILAQSNNPSLPE